MKLTPAEREKLVKELIEMRVKARVSVRALARAAQVSHTYIQLIEAGLRYPGESVLLAYAQRCQVDSDLLLTSWRHTPPDVRARICQKPQLCAVVRAL